MIVPQIEGHTVPQLQIDIILTHCYYLIIDISMSPACGASPSPQSFEFVALFFLL